MRIAFLGLGRMGWHMAAHLTDDRHDHDVVVFDVVAAAMESWGAEHRGTAAESVAAAVTDAELVISSLPADKEVRLVVEQALDHVAHGAVWIDHSTISADGAREYCAALRDRGVDFLDAPVSGGVDGARNGSLTVMAGGRREAFERVEPTVAVYAGRTTLMGESGAGQITKMTNQICVVGVCQALAEGLDFAMTAGLDAHEVVTAMMQGSSTSWQMENRASQMIDGEFDFGFSTTLMRKDIGLVLDEARAMNVSLPVTALVGQFLGDVDALGGADLDWCSLMMRQRQFAAGRPDPETA
ncbi:MAG: NAD(P)-dependent oxidoreductase [Acidimicrobiales bacterium]|jgi:3-hydroxyisobutyrate dehydrogenase-like beta-hydroxyacid dehydrogenase|nr:NAD(P)-dependent oxidoreductase [Acidimicrobiales bacterium]